MKLVAIHQLPALDWYEYEDPPSDSHVYSDEILHPDQVLTCTIYRHDEAKWVKTGRGNVKLFIDAERKLVRIKAIDKRLHLKVHAYFGAGHPISQMPSDSKAFVTKLWSSTLGRNRAFFAFRFEDPSQAGAFFALFKAGTIMAKVLRKESKDAAKDGDKKKGSVQNADENSKDKEDSDINEEGIDIKSKKMSKWVPCEPKASLNPKEEEDESISAEDDDYMVNESQALMSLNLNL